MMRIACLADLHGHLPDLSAFDFDALLLGGDIGPHPAHDLEFQERWFGGRFRAWLEDIGRPVVAVAGNHDVVLQRRPDLVPGDLPWAYLQDSGTTLGDLKVYGSPWQPTFGVGWAFNADEAELSRRWAAIPDDTDILLLHGPPRGHGDLAPDGRRTGSPSLAVRIESIRPRLVVYGHIHCGRGIYRPGFSTLVNAAHVDEQYQPVHTPILVEIRDSPRSKD